MIKNSPKKPFWGKKGIKLCLFIFFLVVSFLWTINANAKTISQLDESILSPFESDVGSNVLFLGTNWQAGNYYFDEIVYSSSSWQGVQANARFGTQGQYFKNPTIYPTTSTLISQVGNKIYKRFYFTFDTTTSTEQLFIFVYRSPNVYDIAWYGTSTEPYLFCETWGQYLLPCNSVDNFGTPYFIFGSKSEGVDFINITYPIASSTPDFNSWHIDYGFSTSTLKNAGHSIKYSQNLSECVGYNNGSGCFMDFEPTHTQNEIYAPIVKLNDLPIGNYQAQANLYNNNYIVATSSLITFTITGQPQLSTLYELPTTTWATSTLPFQITCDPDSSWYSYSICKVLVYLFVPNSNTLNKFNGLAAGISSKVPIGYFTEIREALEEFSSTTPIFTLDIDETEPVYTEVFEPIKTGLAWILWFAFAFWIFHRFRYFNLTSP